MSVLSPPPYTRNIGTVLIAGKPVAVQGDISWLLYWAQGLYERAGGATGSSTTDLEIAAFEDAGISELSALQYAANDAAAQGNELASLREELATLRARLEAIEQGVSL